MERHYFGLATLLASVALLIWSIGETFAFPQGPNVSMGSNPYWATGGLITAGTNSSIITVPSNSDLLITDVIVTVYGAVGTYGACTGDISLETSSGNTLGRYRIIGSSSARSYTPNLVSHDYSSGLPILSGEDLVITNHASNCAVAYSLSGHYINP